MRPHQWTKNLVTFAALIFSQNFMDRSMLVRSVEAFVVFCLLSGMIYLINDLADIEKDKLHEGKKLRPLPSGVLKVSVAWMMALIGSSLAFYFAWRIGLEFLFIAGLFFWPRAPESNVRCNA